MKADVGGPRWVDDGTMTELAMAARRTELDHATEDLRELCEEVAVPMQAQQYIAYFCGAGGQSPSDKALRRRAFYAGIDRFQRAVEAVGDLEAAGYAPREAASIEKESARFARLRREISAAAGD